MGFAPAPNWEYPLDSFDRFIFLLGKMSTRSDKVLNINVTKVIVSHYDVTK